MGQNTSTNKTEIHVQNIVEKQSTHVTTALENRQIAEAKEKSEYDAKVKKIVDACNECARNGKYNYSLRGHLQKRVARELRNHGYVITEVTSYSYLGRISSKMPYIVSIEESNTNETIGNDGGTNDILTVISFHDKDVNKINF